MDHGEFELEILTPAKQLFSGKVKEVVLPAFDGETGVFASHQDFTGLLGTGALKLVNGGNDHWYVVSGGVYEVLNGKLTILADRGEGPEEINRSEVEKTISELEPQLKETLPMVDFERISRDLLEGQAKLEVHRRMQMN